MKALPTQFDDQSLSGTVATPTCGGCCCCCCCCLATPMIASSLLAQQIAHEGKKNNVTSRRLLTIFAALLVPIMGILAYGTFKITDNLKSMCIADRRELTSIAYERCLSSARPIRSIMESVLVILPLLAIWFLYRKVRKEAPFLSTIAFASIICGIFVVEMFVDPFIIGMLLRDSFERGIDLGEPSFGLVTYVALAIVVTVLVSLQYHQRLIKNKTNANDPPVQPAYTEVQLAQNHVENSTKPNEATPTPQEPSQPNPPAPGAQ